MKRRLASLVACLDGSFSQTKDMISGFMVIEALDMAHAVELARSCPVFENDGGVEIRPALQGT